MPAIGFKKEFKDDLLWGIKTQTIRLVRKRGQPKVGDTLNLYIEMRTPQCELIRKSVCTEILPITIFWNSTIVLNGIKLTKAETKILALADGFLSMNHFMAFFENHYGHLTQCQDGFEGNLIKWEGP